MTAQRTYVTSQTPLLGLISALLPSAVWSRLGEFGGNQGWGDVCLLALFSDCLLSVEWNPAGGGGGVLLVVANGWRGCHWKCLEQSGLRCLSNVNFQPNEGDQNVGDRCSSSLQK